MAADFGLSFVPGQASPQGGGPQGGALGGGPVSPPVQQAIKMLSLRLPRVVGANAMAPGALLNAPGAGGMNLQQLLALMFGQHPQGPGMGSPMGGGMMGPGGGGSQPAFGAPRVIPGQGGQPGGPTPVPGPGPMNPAPRETGVLDRTTPGTDAGTYQPGLWSVRNRGMY